MSEQFKAWARSASFTITMNESGITTLLDMYGDHLSSATVGAVSGWEFRGAPSAASYLERRGLISRNDGSALFYLTDEGLHVARLLIMAGFTSYRWNLFCERHQLPTNEPDNKMPWPEKLALTKRIRELLRTLESAKEYFGKLDEVHRYGGTYNGIVKQLEQGEKLNEH